jgi:hypothetical protein
MPCPLASSYASADIEKDCRQWPQRFDVGGAQSINKPVYLCCDFWRCGDFPPGWAGRRCYFLGMVDG